MTRAEIWDRTNTERRAIIRAVVSARRRRAIGREETLELEIACSDPAVQHLTRSAVIRLQEEGEASAFSLWRVVRDTAALRQDGTRVRQLSAHALWMDLRHGRVRQNVAGGAVSFSFGLIGLTPERWLEDIILPGYDGQAIAVATGTVERTDPVDLTFDGTSPLDALRMLEQASRGELAFRYSSDGRTCFVDLLSRVGRATGGAQLRYGRNILGLERLEDDTEAISRLYAQGGGLLTLADAEWIVQAVAGTTGARRLSWVKSPVFEDGAFVGMYLQIGSTFYPITASDVDTGEITVNDSGRPAIAAGARAVITTDTNGTRLAYLESPSARAEIDIRTGQLRAEDVPDAFNILQNSDFADSWSGGAPAGWSVIGNPTLSEVTDATYARHGGKAVRVVTDAGDEGLISDPVTVPTGDARRPYLGMAAGLTVASGAVRIELRHSNGNVYPLSQQAGSTGLGTYLTLSAGPVHDEPLPAGSVQMAIVANGGPADFYLDTAMVTPQLGSDVPAFVRDSGAWALWDRAVFELWRRSVQAREYRVSIADLYRIDPERFPHDELQLGDDVRVWDPEFGTHTLRIVEIADDPWRAETTEVAVAPGPWQRPIVEDLDVFRPLYGPLRPGAPAAPVNPPLATPVTTHSWAEQGEGKILRLTVDPPSATIFYRLEGSPTWASAPGPSVEISFSLASGPQVVEFYSQIPGREPEKLQRARFDPNSLPEFDALVLAEIAPNRLLATLTEMDDDIVRWSLWARVGALPYLAGSDGQPTGEPDPKYLRDEGPASRQPRPWHAINGTWYAVARAYDSRGRYLERTASIIVAGSPGSQPELSSVAVQLVGGSHRLTWAHNAAVDSTFRVVIRETVDGQTRDVLTLGAARPPTWDPGEQADTTPDAGGYDVPVQLGSAFKRFDYEIMLYEGAIFRRSYTVSIEGSTYASEGGAAPVMSPSNLMLGMAGSTLVATWLNTSETLQIELEYQVRNLGVWERYATVMKAQGSTTDTSLDGVLTPGMVVRFYARYVNSAGAGPWSSPSFPLTVR